MATKLTNLRVEEISGVDDPANELPGWLVIKSKDGTVDEEATKEHAQLVLKNYAMLYSCLVAGREYFDGAPDDTVKSVDEVIAFLEKVLTGESEEEEEETEEEETEAKESKTEDEADEKKFRTFIAKLLRGAEAEGAAAASEEPEAEATKDGKPEVEKTEEVEETEAAKTEEEEPETEAVKSADDEVKETLEVVKDVLGKIADRLEKVEQGTAGRTSIVGQEDEATKSNGGSGTLTDAFRAASRGGKVTIR